MARRRHLILLLDGSGVTAAGYRGFSTYSNVYRLNLALQNHNDEGEVQIAFYISGIGSSTTRRRLKAEALGLGLLRDVEQAYINVCSNYSGVSEGRPDRIYIFGFSRGAIVARLVAGIIAEFGLLHEKDAGWFPVVWRQFLESQLDRFTRELDRDGGARPTDFTDRFRESLRSSMHLEDEGYDEKLPADVERRCHRHVQIDFLGLFDSVLGLYYGDYDREIAKLLLGRQLLPRRVKYALHLLALDETRPQFRPILFHGVDESSSPEKLEQIWLPGVHTDIGGGYPEHELADVSLLTMLERMQEQEEPLKLNEAFYRDLKERVLRIIGNDQHRITIHDEKYSLIWRLTRSARGNRKPEPSDGSRQRIHSFCRILHSRQVVWKSHEQPV